GGGGLPATAWPRAHWRRLEACYARTPFFETYRPMLQQIYLDRVWRSLSDFNQHVIRTIAHECLGLDTRFRDSREFDGRGCGRQERLLETLRQPHAELYVSGPAAKVYIEPDGFARAGIDIVWKDYAGYPEYPQAYPPFVHEVTILDLLFHTGPDAQRLIWGWRSEAG